MANDFWLQGNKTLTKLCSPVSMYECFLMCISRSYTGWIRVPWHRLMSSSASLLCQDIAHTASLIFLSHWEPGPVVTWVESSFLYRVFKPDLSWAHSGWKHFPLSHKCSEVCSRWWLYEQCLPHWHPDSCKGSTNELSVYQTCTPWPVCSYLACNWIPVFQGHWC